jgi:hypothetical protein
MSFFNSTMGKVFAGYAVSEGAKYVKESLYSGSFLESGLKSFGKSTGLDRLFGSTDPVGDLLGKVGKGVTQTVADRMLAQGLGADPRTGKGFPGGPAIPSRDTYQSTALPKGARRYAGFPQGSMNVIDAAFELPEIGNMAMEYTQARIPSTIVTQPTIRTGGMGKLGALGKGKISSTKV